MNNEEPEGLMYRPIKKDTGLRLKFPFFDYAASNWSHHFKASEAAGEDQAGVDIHGRDSYGRTPLHALFNCPVFTRLLLQTGTDANATDNDGATPLHRVMDIESMCILVEEGHADINAVRHEAGTPLHALLSRPHPKMTAKFLEYGPGCSVVDGYGNGMLHSALMGYHVDKDIVESLLKLGADPNLKDNKGLTPILHAAVGDYVEEENIDLLTKAGADVCATDNCGENILFRQFDCYNKRKRGKFDTWVKKGVPTMIRNRKGPHPFTRSCGTMWIQLQHIRTK